MSAGKSDLLSTEAKTTVAVAAISILSAVHSRTRTRFGTEDSAVLAAAAVWKRRRDWEGTGQSFWTVVGVVLGRTTHVSEPFLAPTIKLY